MATSKTPVKLPTGDYVNLYAATGITVGTKIIVQNIGSADANLSESAASPTSTTGFNILPVREFFTNNDGNVGAWAISELGTTLQVEES